jgi:hypothetical protein
MATERQIVANQANAQKSTGPRTAQGKAASRRNALKHGMTCDHEVLPIEDVTRYKDRLQRWNDAAEPGDAIQEYLVASGALASVKLDRCARHELAEVARRRRRAVGRCTGGQTRRVHEIVKDWNSDSDRRLRDLDLTRLRNEANSHAASVNGKSTSGQTASLNLSPMRVLGGIRRSLIGRSRGGRLDGSARISPRSAGRDAGRPAVGRGVHQTVKAWDTDNDRRLRHWDLAQLRNEANSHAASACEKITSGQTASLNLSPIRVLGGHPETRAQRPGRTKAAGLE